MSVYVNTPLINNGVLCLCMPVNLEGLGCLIFAGSSWPRGKVLQLPLAAVARVLHRLAFWHLRESSSCTNRVIILAMYHTILFDRHVL